VNISKISYEDNAERLGKESRGKNRGLESKLTIGTRGKTDLIAGKSWEGGAVVKANELVKITNDLNHDGGKNPNQGAWGEAQGAGDCSSRPLVLKKVNPGNSAEMTWKSNVLVR